MLRNKRLFFQYLGAIISVVVVVSSLILIFLDTDDLPEAPVFKGGFETGDEYQWQQLHYNKNLSKNRQFSIVTSPVRDGKYAAKMVVHNNDKFKQTFGERCDLKRDPIYDENENDEYWYAWSTFFPKDWQTPTSWFVFADWHSSYKEVCQVLQLEVTTKNGILAKVLTGDVSGYKCFTGSGTAFKKGKVIVKTLKVNTWNDFIIHVKWTAKKTGFIEIFHKTEDQENFTKVLNLKNIPTLQYKADINNPGSPYFKLAHYRSEKNTHTSTLYHDGFRQGKTKKSIVSGDLYQLKNYIE